MSADTAAFAPIDAPRRILALDAIRGFALLGIFLMNVEWFSRPMQELGSGIAPGATGLDHAVAWLRSEEHTSELQSLMRISYAVFCLKKQKHKKTQLNAIQTS